MRSRKQDLDTEVNLVSFISLLSVLICFLLLTAIWVQIGSINVKQAVGGQSAEETEKKPSLWTLIREDGEVVFKPQDFTRAQTKVLGGSIQVKGTEDGEYSQEEIGKALEAIRLVVPELKTALVQPNKKSEYSDVIEVMDLLKEQGFIDLGVAPL